MTAIFGGVRWPWRRGSIRPLSRWPPGSNPASRETKASLAELLDTPTRRGELGGYANDGYVSKEGFGRDPDRREARGRGNERVRVSGRGAGKAL